jgi:hypothetical protein
VHFEYIHNEIDEIALGHLVGAITTSVLDAWVVSKYSYWSSTHWCAMRLKDAISGGRDNRTYRDHQGTHRRYRRGHLWTFAVCRSPVDV